MLFYIIHTIELDFFFQTWVYFWLLRQVGDCWSNRAGLPPSNDECPPIWCLKKMTMKTESQSDRLFDDSSRVYVGPVRVITEEFQKEELALGY